MSLMTGLWLMGGVACGELHARALWLATQRQRSIAWAPLRLLAVWVFLGVALYFDGLTAVLGWALGFPGAALWRVRPRWRSR